MSEAHIGVLLPARLETRFRETACDNEEGEQVPCWKLQIAIIPDEPWMDRHSDIVSENEFDLLRALWSACQNDPIKLRTTDKGQMAFRTLAQQVGAARAWWLVTNFGPDDEMTPGQKQLSRMDALPEQIEIWLGIGEGDQVNLQRLEPPMKINKEALIFDGADGSAFNLFGDGRWWTKDAGLQAEYELPFSDEAQLREIEMIMAVGLGNGRPHDLFENHRSAGALSLLSLGAPTNTISGEPAADLAQDADTWWRLLSNPGEKGSRADVAATLTGKETALEALPGGTGEHRRLNEELLRLLWPSLWRHTLQDVWGVDRALGWREAFEPGRRSFSSELGLWAQDWLHPEGPLAPLRIGDQPYGLWPVTRINDGAWQPAAGDPLVEDTWIIPWLSKARGRWAAGARRNSGTVAGVPNQNGAGNGADNDHFVQLLGRVPSASDYGYRPFLPLQVMYLLSHSLLGEDSVQRIDDWRNMTTDLTRDASEALNFPVQPVRRYMTTGSRQDLELPIVEHPSAADGESGLGTGWTHIAGTANGGFLLYNKKSGVGRTARIDNLGNYQYISSISGFSKGWTHIVSVRRDKLLLYNEESGAGAAARLDSRGKYHSIAPILGLEKGWTHVTGTANGGLLFYNKSTGMGRTAWIDKDGNYHDGIPIPGFSMGWTHIVSANEGGILFYDKEKGLGAMAWLDGTGGYQYIDSVSSFLIGWTHIMGTADGGLIFIKTATGEAATAYLDGFGKYQNGQLVTEFPAAVSHIAGTAAGILFYNDATGEGATAFLDGAGKYQFIGSNWSVFFTHLEQLLQIEREHGFARLFESNIENCEFLLQPASLLMRLILNAIATMHAEMGRMRENLEFEGLPLIEPFHLNNYCTELQQWCLSASDLRMDLLFDDDFVRDFLNVDEGYLPQVQDWPVVHLYRGLVATLFTWQGSYHDALQREKEGESDAVRKLAASIDRAFRAVLDTAALRIDPWITGVAWRRLKQMRAEGRPDSLGLYAWVDKPYRGTPGPTAGGTLLAPSHDQLLTSLIMRDKFINDPQDGRWQMNLDSAKVRLAKRFADEVRAGGHIQEVLGRAVEEIIGDKEQIDGLRKVFRIRDEHDGRRVCDGQKVLTTAEGDLYLQGLGLLNEQQTALEALRKVTDTYGDLLMANGVHAVVSGRPEKAGETMDAAAGLELPPQFDVLRTPRSGNSANTTVWMALPAGDPPDAAELSVSPALLADAAVARFLEQSIPVGLWKWQVKQADGQATVTLADIGLRVSETLAYSADALRQLAVRHGDGEAVIEKAVDGTPLSPAVGAYDRLRRLVALLSGHIRDVHNPRDEENALQWQAHDDELYGRLETLRLAAGALANALDPDLADPTALLQARCWGIAPAPLDDALTPEEYQLSAEQQLARQLQLAQEALTERIERVEAVESAGPTQQIAKAIADLSGNAMPIYGRAQRAILENGQRLEPHPTLDRDWLETVAAVRPALAKVEAHQLGTEPALKAWANRSDPWASEDTGEEKRVKRPSNLVVCFSPGDAALDGELAVIVIDGWSEMIPEKRHIAEAAFGFNAPSSRAPQAILLAVPPDETKPLDNETLAHIVLEARETAHARMATPADIEPYAALFPLAMVPALPPTGVSMQSGGPD